MPLSRDPAKRSKQLDNLRRGGMHAGGRPVQHGAYAALPAKRVDAKVQEVADAIGADAPVRADDGGLPAHDAIVVRQLAETLCRLDDVTAYLQRRGFEDDAGKPRTALDIEHRLRSHVLDLLRELGMTPSARAKLGLDLVRAASAQDTLQEHLTATYGGEST